MEKDDSCVKEFFCDSSSSGVKLFARHWKPGPNIKIRGTVFVCHGLAEHLQWYDELATALTKDGFFVFGHDHVGHGRSDGIRAYIDNVDIYVKDVYEHCQTVKQIYPDLPHFVYGHSMGGLITLKCCLDYPDMFKGMILEGPLIVSDEATPFKLALCRIAAYLFPYAKVIPLKLGDVTRNKEIQQQLQSDPLRYLDNIRTKMAIALFEAATEVNNKLTQVRLPFLIQHGEKDKLCSLQGSHLLQELAESNDKTIKIYPEATHNLLLELPEVKEETIRDAIEWLVQRS